MVTGATNTGMVAMKLRGIDMDGNQGIEQDGAQEPVSIEGTMQRMAAIASSINLAPQIDDATLTKWGEDVTKHFDIDLESMTEWSDRMERAINLALLVKSSKDYPWTNSSNAVFPLITSAALQYNARAYPAIVPPTDVVKASVQGKDPQGIKAARASRVARFETWQLTGETDEWERGTDQMLMLLPIIGDVFRKTWFDPAQGKLRHRLRLPGRHIVINNNAPSLEGAPRISDQIELYPEETVRKIASGEFLEFEKKTDEDDESPSEFIEQHLRYDLDGDGYPEPYVCTVHKESRKVVRVVAGFDPEDVRVTEDGRVASIERVAVFTHYQLMPSMDGGFFGTGLGLLLGDISDMVNSTINMINDAGHMQSLGGGFIGAKDFRIKGGVQVRRPGEYKLMNVYGDDIRKGIVDVQHPGPSPVLFQMLGMLINAAREIASVNDVMTGDAGRQNMPVGTVMALIEQGMMVFSASYKRIYMSLKSEFRLITRLNRRHVTPEQYNEFLDEDDVDEQGQPVPVVHDPAQDFDLSNMDILPVADPKSVTSMQTMARAQFLLELAEKGMIDKAEAMTRILDAASIADIEKLMPKPDPVQQMMLGAQQEMLVLDIRLKEAEIDQVIATTQAKMAQAVKDLATADAEETLAPMRARIEQMKAAREMISARAVEIQRGIVGGMAGAPGNGGGAGNPGAGGGIQQGALA